MPNSIHLTAAAIRISGINSFGFLQNAENTVSYLKRREHLTQPTNIIN
ncbi:hypothetical protein [Nostoc sp.]